MKGNVSYRHLDILFKYILWKIELLSMYKLGKFNLIVFSCYVSQKTKENYRADPHRDYNPEADP